MTSAVPRLREFILSGIGAAGRLRPAAGPSRRWLRLLPTRYGLVYLAMLTALLLGAVNHNNNLGYLLTFLLGGMAAVSALHTRRNLAGITVASVRANPVFAGQKAIFELTIEPCAPARPAISLCFPGGEATFANLGPDAGVRVQTALAASRRGVLAPSALVIATTYPLGLFQARRLLPVSASCLVYPKPVPGPLLSVPGPEDKESEGDAGGSGVEDFSGLAPYQPGDPLQRLAWKAYSRGQGLFSKKFEGLRGKSVYFDPDALPGHDLELKLSRTCHMILVADAMRTPYGLRYGGRLIKPGLGDKHKHECLRELALAVSEHHDVP